MVVLQQKTPLPIAAMDMVYLSNLIYMYLINIRNT